jgi:multidrug efflux pump subunit AcrA (membrane-fusion protein)
MRKWTSIAVLLLAGAVVARGGAAEPPAGAEGRGKLFEVPSRFDGIVMTIGREVREREKVPADLLFTVRIGEVTQKYRRLGVGDAVKAGEVLARLDDLLVRDELALNKQKASAAEAEWKATLKARDEAAQRYATMERMFNGPVLRNTSLEDLRAAKLTWDRYWYEEISKKAAIDTAKLEVKSAEHRLDLHAIRSRVRGTIVTIYKQPGEAVKAFEPLLQVRIAPGRPE